MAELTDDEAQALVDKVRAFVALIEPEVTKLKSERVNQAFIVLQHRLQALLKSSTPRNVSLLTVAFADLKAQAEQAAKRNRPTEAETFLQLKDDVDALELRLLKSLNAVERVRGLMADYEKDPTLEKSQQVLLAYIEAQRP